MAALLECCGRVNILSTNPGPAFFRKGQIGGGMRLYILKRLAGMVVVMFLVSTIVFVIIRVIPGDPAALMLGVDATAADVEALRDKLGLDRPLWSQYAAFLADLSQGDLGKSIFHGGVPVLDLLAGRAEPTICLTSGIRSAYETR